MLLSNWSFFDAIFSVTAFSLMACLMPARMLLGEQLALSVKAESAILMNADTGAILYEKEAHTPRYPASIVKIATALYTLEKIPDQLDVEIAADQDSIGIVTEAALKRSNYTMPAYLLIPDASHIGIKRGEILSLRDLLYGMMLASGDDASNVIAKHAGGTIPAFMDELNAFIKKLGCNETTLMNPHGLHHPKQTTTAYDMALLARAALKNPTFCHIVSTVRYMRPKTNKQEPTILMQGNRLLRNGPLYYPKAIGLKTGYYSLAGSNVVAAARDGDRTLIAVLLKNSDRKQMFIDAKNMFEAAFSQPMVRRTFLKQGPQKFSLVLPGSPKPVKTYTTEDLAIDYYPAEEPKVKCMIYWTKGLKLPVAKGAIVGEVVIEEGEGQALKKAPLYAQEEVKSTFGSRTKEFFIGLKTSKFLKALGLIAFLAAVGYFFLRNRLGG